MVTKTNNWLIDKDILALASWDIDQNIEIVIPENGLINKVAIIRSKTGVFVFKRYSFIDFDRVSWIHSLMRFASEQQIPVALPLKMSDGWEVLEAGSYCYSLYEFVAGRHFKTSELTAYDITRLGNMLAEIHGALSRYSEKYFKTRKEIDWESTFERIESFAAVIAGKPDFDHIDGLALKHLEMQKTWLCGQVNRHFNKVNELTQQIIHGDYQPDNVLIDGRGALVAILDWDLAHRAPVEMDIIRSLHYFFNFCPEKSSIFLAAYHQKSALNVQRLHAIANNYFLYEGHDLWLFKEAYVHHNERARSRFTANGFVSAELAWKKMMSSPLMKDI